MGKKNKRKDQNILVVKNLAKHFGEVHAVDGVNVEISRGEVLCLVGPNGAGKTTFLKLLSGDIKPDAGKIIFEGNEIGRKKVQDRVKLGIAYSFQIPALFENLTTLDNVRVSICSRENKTLRFLLIDRYSNIMKESTEILNRFGLSKNQLGIELPHGKRKILDSLIAFVQNSKLILLDEPTSGISVEEKDAIMESLISYLRSRKVATIVVEHDLDVVAKYSDRVIVMSEGKFLTETSPKRLMDDKVVKETLGI